MEFKFEYTNPLFLKLLLISYISFCIIGCATLIFYGSIEPGTFENKIFIITIFGVPIGIFMLGLGKYKKIGQMIIYDDNVLIIQHYRTFKIRFSDLKEMNITSNRGFHVKLKTHKNIKYRINASYFTNEGYLWDAVEELKRKIEQYNRENNESIKIC